MRTETTDPQNNDISVAERDINDPYATKIKPKMADNTDPEVDLYVDPKEMWDEMKECYDKDTITENMGDMIMRIARKMSMMPNFKSYSWRDMMESESTSQMCEAVQKKSFSLYSEVEVDRVEDQTTKKGNDTITKTVVYYRHFNKRKKVFEIRGKEFDPDYGDVLYKKGKTDMYKFKNNAFGYFSRCSWNGAIGELKRNLRYVDTRTSYAEVTYDDHFAAGGSMEMAKRHTEQTDYVDFVD